MTVLLQANATTGFGAGFDLVPAALRCVRTRMLDVCDNLDVDDWQTQSRCDLWSVHDVVRHVRDACRIHVANLQGQPTAFSSGDAFDARETPRRWLERTAGQTSADTIRELQECGAAEELALAGRRPDSAHQVVGGPYGEIHWTLFSAHVLWDAWLHARDVTEVLGGGDRSTPVEDGVAGFYSLLIASMSAMRVNHDFDITVGMTGGDGTRYTARVVPGSVTLGTAQASDHSDLDGELALVADALAGRGPELDSVLHGQRSVLEPLTWLRPRLLPASNE